MGIGLRPGAKAPDEPPTPPYRLRASPRLYSVDAARAEVDTYAPALGRLPAVLLSRAEKVDVNAGDPEHPNAVGRGSLGGRVTTVFGGNYSDRSITIHTGYGQRIQRDGFPEEALFHEGAHVSLQNHQDAPGWRAAQEADGEYISDYARDFPDREDVAESLLPYFAIRYRPDRLSAGQRAAIADTIPNRMEYFDGLAIDWSPYMRVDADGPAPTMLTLSADPDPSEGGNPVTVTATLENPAPANGMTVTLTTGGTATLDTDYTLSSTTITLAEGETSGTVTITVTDDAEDDDGETIVIDAESTSPALTAEQLTLTIEDNDVTPVPALPLRAAMLLGLLLLWCGAARARMPDRTDIARGCW